MTKRDEKMKFWGTGDLFYLDWVVVTWYVKICHLELKMCALYSCQSKIKISKNEFLKRKKERSPGQKTNPTHGMSVQTTPGCQLCKRL